MAKNKKSGKKYVPRPKLKNPLEFVIQGMKIVSEEKQLTVNIVNHDALYAITHGTGTKSEWDAIAALLNTSFVLCQSGFGEEHMEDVRKAMEAHWRCGRRNHLHGKYGYAGPEIQQVALGLELYEAQLQIVPVRDLELAHLKVYHLLLNGNVEYEVKKGRKP